MVDKDKVWDRTLNTTMLIQVQTKRSYIATLSIGQLAIHTPQLARIPCQLYQGYLFILCSLDGWVRLSYQQTKASQLLALAQQARDISTLYLRSGPKNNTLKNKSISGQFPQPEQHLLKLNYLKLPDELPIAASSDSLDPAGISPSFRFHFIT